MPAKKSFLEDTADCIKATTTVSTFLVFPVALFAYIYVGGKLTKELGCSSFTDVILDRGGCNPLKQMLILNGAAAWAEGDFITIFSIFAVLAGIFLGLGRYFYRSLFTEQSSTNQVADNVHAMLSEPLLFEEGEEVIEFKARPGEHKEEVSKKIEKKATEPQDLIPRIKEMGWNAWMLSRFSLVGGIFIGTPIMLKIARGILHDFGCHADVWDLFLFSWPKECSIQPVYWAMTAFAYPWAFSTWGAYLTWELSMLYQVVPARYRPSVNGMFSRLRAWLGVEGCLSKAFTEENKAFIKDFFSCVKLGVKTVGLGALLVLIAPVLLDGLAFSNAVLERSGCEVSLLEIVFSSNFDTGSFICSPLMQILGMDAFPTKTEIYDLLPLSVLTVLAGSAAGALLGAVKLGLANGREGARYALRETLTRWHASVNDVFDKGFYLSLLFIPVSTYGILWCAIPKANALLKAYGCENSQFPYFIPNFEREGCSALDAYRANAAYISTMWIVFSYSGITFFAVGAAGYLASLGLKQIASLLSSYLAYLGFRQTTSLQPSFCGRLFVAEGARGSRGEYTALATAPDGGIV